jgi:uncharacterized protein (DUF2141 family)
MKMTRGSALFADLLMFALPLVAVLAQAPVTTGPSAKVAPGCALRIHLDGLRNSKGNVATVLFASADGWPENSGKAFRKGAAAVPAGQRQVTVTLENLPPGAYGVAAIHDENSNYKLDRNFLGIPKEGFGFANNPHVLLGPASFEQALVRVTCPATEITIQMQYK